MDTIEVKVDGMTCAACAISVIGALQRVPGVAEVDVDIPGGVATVRGHGPSVLAMVCALKQAGYIAAPAGGPAGWRTTRTRAESVAERCVGHDGQRACH